MISRCLLALIVFLIGFLACFLYLELPSLTEPSVTGFFSYPVDKCSPGNWISEKDIHVYPDQIVINLNGSALSTFVDTKSMDPVLDSGCTAIHTRPDKSRIQPGDIISFEGQNGTVVHRISRITQNSTGTYYFTKGDNALLEDPEPLAFEQIESVIVGILY
jgi:hypothetical protein